VFVQESIIVKVKYIYIYIYFFFCNLRQKPTKLDLMLIFLCQYLHLLATCVVMDGSTGIVIVHVWFKKRHVLRSFIMMLLSIWSTKIVRAERGVISVLFLTMYSGQVM
jgi:hypothetical protein